MEWNKKRFLRSLSGCKIDFLRGTEFSKVVYPLVFNSVWSNLVESKCINWVKFHRCHFWESFYRYRRGDFKLPNKA